MLIYEIKYELNQIKSHKLWAEIFASSLSKCLWIGAYKLIGLCVFSDSIWIDHIYACTHISYKQRERKGRGGVFGAGTPTYGDISIDVTTIIVYIRHASEADKGYVSYK